MEVTIVYGESMLKEATHRIQAIHIDNFKKSVAISIRKGIIVDIIELTMEKAEEIGFINTNALKDFVK